MKQYITEVEYVALGGKLPVGDNSLPSLIQLATVKVDEMTLYRIGDISSLTTYQAELVKKATMVQVDYLHDTEANGGLDFDVSSWSITDVSMSFGGNANIPAKEWHKAQNHSSTALAFLNASGLTWRGAR